NDDVGFAPTILSSAQPDGRGAAGLPPADGAPPKVDRAAPMRRGAAMARPSPAPSKEDSKLTLGSAALEMEEPAGLPKRRGWLWAALVVCVGAGGFYGWRSHGFDRIRSFLAPAA